MTDIKKGLAGVVVDTTAVSKVNPDTNSLLYRGYPVQELAANCTFEEVAYLLWHGELPDAKQLADVRDARARAPRPRPPREARDRRAAADRAPMDVVRTAVSVIGALDPDGRRLDAAAPTSTSRSACSRSCRRSSPTTSAAAAARTLVEPRDDLGYAANFLHMTFGEVPDLVVVTAFDVSMILYAEHSFNASTFTARVVTSTLVRPVLGGRRRRSARSRGRCTAARTRPSCTSSTRSARPTRPRPGSTQALAEKRKIMGFGHRVYKNGDSRVPTMKAALDTLVEHYDRPDLARALRRARAAMDARKGIKPNLDYPSGPAYHLIGFDTEIFTPLFVAARVTGWTAHIMEQLAANALIRPLSEYVGPEQREVPSRP